MTRKETIINLLKEVKREGMDKLIEWLEQSSFFEDPASTKYHDSIEGGLAKHSLGVYENFVAMTGRDDDTAKIACLLHDVCKIGTYKKVVKMVKNEITADWEAKVSYDYQDDGLPYGHGEKSVLMIQDYIRLTKEERLMIRWHMGAYESKECWNNLGKAQEMYPSVLYIHFADMLDSKGHKHEKGNK